MKLYFAYKEKSILWAVHEPPASPPRNPQTSHKIKFPPSDKLFPYFRPLLAAGGEGTRLANFQSDTSDSLRHAGGE
jgi:hypothetical protein